MIYRQCQRFIDERRAITDCHHTTGSNQPATTAKPATQLNNKLASVPKDNQQHSTHFTTTKTLAAQIHTAAVVHRLTHNSGFHWCTNILTSSCSLLERKQRRYSHHHDGQRHYAHRLLSGLRCAFGCSLDVAAAGKA
jgi:hypothetical protein